MKVQLDKGALEKIIGGNTEIEVELRNCIVQEMMKKHIKSVCNEQYYKNTINDLCKLTKEEIINVITHHIQENGIPGLKFDYKAKFQLDLTKDLKEEIKKKVKNVYDEFLCNTIKEEIKNLEEQMEKYTKNIIKYYFNESLHKIIKNQMDISISNILDETKDTIGKLIK